MLYALLIGVALIVWTVIGCLYLAKEIFSLFSLGSGRQETWITYVIAAPAIAILYVLKAVKTKRK
jgi:hypothetical protein